MLSQIFVSTWEAQLQLSSDTHKPQQAPVPPGTPQPGVLLLEGCRVPQECMVSGLCLSPHHPGNSASPTLIWQAIQPPMKKWEMTMIHYRSHHGSSPRATHSHGTVWSKAWSDHSLFSAQNQAGQPQPSFVPGKQGSLQLPQKVEPVITEVMQVTPIWLTGVVISKVLSLIFPTLASFEFKFAHDAKGSKSPSGQF